MRVSIIIPVYNAADFIKNCVRSVACQTMSEGVECILVDDCGTDNSMQIAENFVIKNSSFVNFIILHQNHNQGPSAARNRGIREAKGEYVFFLDADDTITPNCIELLYGLAKKYNADYVQGRYKASPQPSPVESENNIPCFLDDRREIKRLLLNHNKIQFTPHNRLVRRQMIIDNDLFFNEEIKVREDFLWMTFVAKYVERFASCDEPTYNRGYNEDSLTNHINREREIKGYRVLIETMVANYDAFQLGAQKELALEALLIAFRANYFNDKTERQHLLDVVMSKNSLLENQLLRAYLKTRNSKLLHLLTGYYKRRD